MATIPTNPASATAAALMSAMAKCASGDRSGLRAIYDSEAPAMIGVAMRILRRRELAEEAVQDAFVRIWNNAAKFDPARGQARSWLYAIVRHRALDILRGDARTDLVDDFEPLRLASDEESPEALVSRLSDAKALRRCLEKLEPKRRSAIVLAYVNGLSYGEVAGKLNIPLGTVKSWIRRGLMALKECMA